MNPTLSLIPSLEEAALAACLILPLLLLRQLAHFIHSTLPPSARHAGWWRVLPPILMVLYCLILAALARHYGLPAAWSDSARVWLAHTLLAVSVSAMIVLLGSVVLRHGRREGRRLQALIPLLEHEAGMRAATEQSLQESRNTLRELAAHQEQIREAERKRIAAEIHDDLGQNLLALRLDVATLRSRTGARHQRLARRIDEVLANIDATVRSMRSIMNRLRPPVLDIGLVAAADWQVAEFRRTSGVACAFEAEACDDQLDETQSTTLFRILQDALLYVGRHSQVTRVQISLYADNGRVILSVRDNGVGFYPNNRRKTSRFILLGIRERAATLGGELTVQDIEGAGSELHVSVPIQRPLPH